MFRQGTFTEEWTWNFDLKGREYYNSRSVIKVMAVAFVTIMEI